jgi:hypothetical protein
MAGKLFANSYKPIVVLANPKTILHILRIVANIQERKNIQIMSYSLGYNRF